MNRHLDDVDETCLMSVEILQRAEENSLPVERFPSRTPVMTERRLKILIGNSERLGGKTYQSESNFDCPRSDRDMIIQDHMQAVIPERELDSRFLDCPARSPNSAMDFGFDDQLRQ